MTGNTKVWRAPLAGLAAVAMLATMGVAASTANAASDPEFAVTFDTNGYGTLADSQKKVTLTASDHYKLGAKADTVKGSIKDAPAGWVFTGWYTSPDLGEGEKVNTQSPLLKDTTVYAHWSKSGDVRTVQFSGATSSADFGDSDQDGAPGDTRVTLAPGDKLASWEKPTDNGNMDGKIVGENFTDTSTKKAFDFGAAPTAKKTIVRIEANTDVQQVTFTDATFNGGKNSYEVDVPNGDAVTAPAARAADGKYVDQWQITSLNGGSLNVPEDPSFTDQDILPETAKDSTGEEKDVTSVTLTAAATDDASTAYAVRFTLTPNPFGQTLTPVYVAAGSEIPLPTIETGDDAYVFSGWKTADKSYIEGDAVENYADGNHDVFLTGSLSWTGVEYTVTFNPDFTGSKPTVQKVKKGSEPEWVDAPARTGYVFQGWNDGAATYKNAKELQKAYHKDGVHGVVTFTARWLTTTQDQLQQLLDLDLNAYNEGDAKEDYTAKVDEIDKAVVSVGGLAKLSEKAGAAYVKELTALKAKLVTSSQKFTDVYTDTDTSAGTPHSDDINFLADKGISTGYADGTYKPTGSMYRQDFAAFLYRLAGSPEYTPAASDNIFTDVTPATPHYKEILWAAKQGIIKGFADGTFKGLNLVNRQDAAAFLYRAAGSPEFDASKAAKTFTDVNESTPHYKEVLWAANTVVSQDYDGNGTTDSATAIIQGFQAGTFDGYATLLRQDGAAFLARTYFYINK